MHWPLSAQEPGSTPHPDTSPALPKAQAAGEPIAPQRHFKNSEAKSGEKTGLRKREKKHLHPVLICPQDPGIPNVSHKFL